jgi:hypothetical protein
MKDFAAPRLERQPAEHMPWAAPKMQTPNLDALGGARIHLKTFLGESKTRPYHTVDKA